MPPVRYPVLNVSGWELIGAEPAGAGEHPWLQDPATKQAWLWKPVVVHGDRQQGEDWSEKAASEIGRAVGVPCAQVELATRRGRDGCVSLSLIPHHWEMQPGAVLLASAVDAYQPGVKGRPGHSLSNIRSVLARFGAPPDAAVPSDFDAFDVFAGYLVLDALIANRDRHDSNWSILRPPPGLADEDRLCGSYDHASSLGFNLLDEERTRRLQQRTIQAWARRGTAYKFEHDPAHPPPTLVSLATHALTLCSDQVRHHWLGAVDRLEVSTVRDILGAIPGLSEPAAMFALELVTTNRRRMLGEP